MTAIPDCVAAVVSFLKTDTAVAGIAGMQIYGAELPEYRNTDQPSPTAVVLRPSGSLGLFGGYLECADQRIDCYNYAPTARDSFALHLAVHGALKQMRRNVQGQTVLHWAKQSGGPVWQRDPVTEWPMTFVSWQVMFSERLVGS